MLPANRPIGGRVPDLRNRRAAQIPEDMPPVEVRAAQRHTAVPQHRERLPQPVTRELDIRMTVQRAGPIVQIRDVDLIGHLTPFLNELLFFRAVFRRLPDERQNQFRVTATRLIAQPHQRPNVVDDRVVIEIEPRRFEGLLAGRIDADVDGVESGIDHAARYVLGNQGAVADHADFFDAARFRVADLFDELLIEKRFAVVVHADMRDAQRGALVDDFSEQLEVHHALPAMHLVTRAEYALRVAQVRALDLDDIGPAARL